MKLQAFSFLSGIMLFVHLFVCFPSVYANSPWDVHRDERRMTALYKGLVNGDLEFQTETGVITFNRAPELIMALSGRRTGQLVIPAEYPQDIQVEVLFNSLGQVRAVKNIQLPLISPVGSKLTAWGHDLIYSPDGTHYLLYHFQRGLSLHSLEKELSSYLSNEPIAAWNSTGTKFACTDGQDLRIYELLKLDEPKIIKLPTLPANVTRVITGLEWAQDDNRLLYYCLEDLPNLGSEVFRIAVLDSLGNETASKYEYNLGYARWADDSSVILVNYSDLEASSGRIVLWYPKTDETKVILPWTEGICEEFAYNKANQVIAYTISEGIGQEIRFISLDKNQVRTHALSSPYPLRNMQWSKNNSLCYWDEFNEIIWQIHDPLENAAQAQPVVTGYLPKSGVQENFLYFLSEPLEEPLQPYLYQ